MTVFQIFTPLELLQFFILKILGADFVDDTELLGAAFLCVSSETPFYTVLVSKNVILEQSFCVFTYGKVTIFSVPFP